MRRSRRWARASPAGVEARAGTTAHELRRRPHQLRAAAALAGAAALLLPFPTVAQSLRGSVLEAGTDRPVALAGLLLLGRDSIPVSSALADSLGRFRVPVPAGGEYYLAAERLGYRSTLSPLLALSDTSTYEVDVEMAPEPVGLEGLEVEVRVRPEAMERWLTLRGHVGNPNRLIGYRALYGARVEEARAGARDNTDFLRRLFIPIHHGREVCIRPRQACVDGFYLDDRWMPSALIESVDLPRIAAVVVLPLDTGDEIHLFTRDFRFGGVGR